ncbi:MAG: DUF3108 domain-containing protein [Gemmatimonadales bacterium]|nr:DUF3108 domain-containing protein [Gemmatimonadales bacterium]MBA3553802.1 DUF3108 domain-containing protein [Gemmatimonadales bacterium]
MIRPFALVLGLLQGPAAPPPPLDYPFAVGERLSYSAKLGMLTLGSGTLEVAALDTVRGEESFRFRFRLTGKTVFYSLDDVLESWVDIKRFSSRRFVQDFVENEKPKQRTYEIYPDSGFYRESGRDTTFATVGEPLDDAAFFYFVRITPLEVGREYVFERYFKKDKNPVTIEVVKREKMELPDGRKVQCLVLHPVIDTKGLFSKRSDTRIWLTDDERRLPVQIRSKFPFGTITLRLKNVELPARVTSTSGR